MFRRQFLYGLLLAPLALISLPRLFADQTVVDADTIKKILRRAHARRQCFYRPRGEYGQ